MCALIRRKTKAKVIVLVTVLLEQDINEYICENSHRMEAISKVLPNAT